MSVIQIYSNCNLGLFKPVETDRVTIINTNKPAVKKIEILKPNKERKSINWLTSGAALTTSNT